MFNTLWRKWLSGDRPATSRKRMGRTLGVEILEDRCVMATSIAEFPILTANGAPFAITTGPDGNLWFTENQASKIGMINPVTHAITEFSIPTANSGAFGITAGPDGNLWFTEYASNRIGMINPTSKVITEFLIPTANSQPTAITAGPDGNLWFTEMGGNKIGMINPTTFAITEFSLTTANSGPSGITVGADGNLWFAQSNTNRIASINPTTRVIAEYPTPTANSLPFGITLGPDNNLWFVEQNANKIGMFNLTTQAISEFAIPTAASGAAQITSGPDGALWFVEFGSNKIGRIHPTTHVITETVVPTAGSSPAWITSGPGGTLWFTESTGNKIGQVVAPPVVTTAPVSIDVAEGQTATFVAAAAVGLPTPTVRWSVSTNGGTTFTPLNNGGVYSGVTTGTLTITGTTLAMNGYRYRATFSNGISPNPTVNTTAAKLTVHSVLSITPALAQGTVGGIYNQTLTIAGSISPFTYLTASNFNAGGTGLTLANIVTNPVDGTIVISGTPTGVGTATFTISVANLTGNSLTQNMVLTIRPPLSIATPALPQATAGYVYRQTITVLGGALPYAIFEVTNFNPGATGLTPGFITALPLTGVFNLAGTPLAGGTVTFTANVTDAAGTTLAVDYTITVNPPFVITPTLPKGTAGTNYHQTVTVTGGGAPYPTFTVTNFSAGTTGLTLANLSADAATGIVTIDGVPLAAGVFSFKVNVVDAAGAALSKTYSVTINSPLSITATLPQGTAGTIYRPTIAVAGGTTPFTTFTISGFSAGTTGLTAGAFVLNPTAGTVAINGTPTAAGTAIFTINVTDTAGAKVLKNYTIIINPTPVISGLNVSQWTAGKAGFTGVMTISGGTVPHTIIAATGLPTGLTAVVNGNTIGFLGTPTTAATFANGSITIRDAAGASVTRTFTITINPAPYIGSLTVTQWTLGRSGFNGVMNVGGGTGGLSIVSATGLPTGLTLALVGNKLSFTGTPTVAKAFAGSVTLRDAIGATVTRTFAITINAVPTLGNLTATQWTVGKAGFTGTMTIAAGTGPFTLISAFGLPTGLSAVVIGNTIRFTGTPSVAQTFASGNITIVDAAGASVSKAFSIKINPPVLITTATLPAAKMAVLYSAPMQTTGGTGVITYTLTAGSLPPGMKLGSNGVISGLSRGLGSFTFTITATDAVGATFSKQYTLIVSLR